MTFVQNRNQDQNKTIQHGQRKDMEDKQYLSQARKKIEPKTPSEPQIYEKKSPWIINPWMQELTIQRKKM